MLEASAAPAGEAVPMGLQAGALIGLAAALRTVQVRARYVYVDPGG